MDRAGSTLLRRVAVLAVLAWLTAGGERPAQAAASPQGYLFITNVPGPVEGSPYAGWIPLQLVDHTIYRPDTNSPASHGAVWFQKTVDNSSPKLAELCNKATRIPRVKLDFLESTAEGNLRYYQMALSNVVVVGYSLSSDSTNTPQDRAGIAYTRADWTYTEYSAHGTPVGDWKTWWNVVSNTGGSSYERSFRLRMTANGKTVRLTWPSKTGFTYEIQGSATPGGTYSHVDTIPSAGDQETTYDLPASERQELFQVLERAN